MTSGRSNLIDLEGHVRAVTDKAILLKVDDRQAWLPRSMIEIEGDAEVGERVTVTLPESFAVEKELV